MGFFDSILNLDFGKAGKTFGKIANQFGNLTSGFSNSSSDNIFGKIWDGISNVDLSQVM
jgi:hypothetical protein